MRLLLLSRMSRSVIFCCPTTGLNVQGLLPAETPENGGNLYLAVSCLACGQSHLMNAVTGKLLSEEQD